MGLYQLYCECKHADHAEGGAGHPISAKISGEDAVPCGWEKGHSVVACRPCVHAGHMKVTS